MPNVSPWGLVDPNHTQHFTPAPAAPAPAQQQNGELDFLADGMHGSANGHGAGGEASAGFGDQPPAWGQQQQVGG